METIWKQLNTQSINHIFDYLNVLEKRKINKYWYNLANKKKNYIWYWYKHHSLRLEMEYEFINNENAIKSYYKLKTPKHIKRELVSLYYSHIATQLNTQHINRLFNQAVDNISISELLEFYTL
jgi:hypothetical protein